MCGTASAARPTTPPAITEHLAHPGARRAPRYLRTSSQTAAKIEQRGGDPSRSMAAGNAGGIDEAFARTAEFGPELAARLSADCVGSATIVIFAHGSAVGVVPEDPEFAGFEEGDAGRAGVRSAAEAFGMLPADLDAVVRYRAQLWADLRADPSPVGKLTRQALAKLQRPGRPDGDIRVSMLAERVVAVKWGAPDSSGMAEWAGAVEVPGRPATVAESRALVDKFRSKRMVDVFLPLYCCSVRRLGHIAPA